ncbi:CocE/NonD family hydrolase [Streptomyces sp. NPDC059161]|uniref:CocE/NonD family hydrolase n=1 Tax=Streptomyces sp. NPDC059161 TaxID=3346749 RepID=UPI0036C3C4BA
MTSNGQQPAAAVSLYPELDEAALAQVVEALRTGDTSRLAPARAAEVTEARKAATFLDGVGVPGDEGVELDAALWLHNGPGPHPLIVMPSPWAKQGWTVYAIQALRFARRGYHVLAYTARGFGESGGEVEVAGEADIADGIRALDYLISQAGGPGAIGRIGFLGDSYGSGISQLVAAEDSRVHAVVALSTWGDLGEAFYENDTRHVAAVRTLLDAAKTARLSARTQQAFDDVLANRNVEETLRWAASRSPYHRVDKLNRRQVPVLFANAWHETLFPTNQTLKMFNALSGPKRLLLSVGDHSGPEMTGILGLPNRIWQDAHRWFDHHLLEAADDGSEAEAAAVFDADSGAEDQVVSEIMWSRTLESRPSWHAATGDPERFYLTGPAEGAQDGGLLDKPGNGWRTTFTTGTDTPATVADAILLTGYAELAGLPKTYRTGRIDRNDAGVWSSAPLPSRHQLRGVPRLRVTVAPSAPDSTFVAYLFDVNALGIARIITHAPYTVRDGDPDAPVTVDIALQATGYDVRAGHRLMLVLDSVDPFYGPAAQPPGTITVTSPDEDPSYLELPLS